MNTSWMIFPSCFIEMRYLAHPTNRLLKTFFLIKMSFDMLVYVCDERIFSPFKSYFIPLQGKNGVNKVGNPCSWIHSDIMDDNIHMELRSVPLCSGESAKDAGGVDDGSMNGYDDGRKGDSWSPSHILDFSDLSLG